MKCDIGSTVRGKKKISIGRSCYPVVFANVGISSMDDELDREMVKAKKALSAGADIIAELSISDGIPDIQKRFIDELDCPLSSVAIYEAYILAKKTGLKIPAEKVIRLFEESARRGMDVITVHATILRDDIQKIKKTKRMIPTTSRGGAMALELSLVNGYENPYFTYFDDVLDIAKKYGVCISLGPSFRTGAVCDCGKNDELDAIEIARMAELAARAQKCGVGILIEGIGHVTLDKIPLIVPHSIKLCHDAPYRVLTVATDIALGYDHVASAIAAANAVMYGASSITAVSRSEHIGLPGENDVTEAVISARIAAHCGYIARTGDGETDKKMAEARHKYGCIGDPSLSLCKNVNNARVTEKRNSVSCGMCGEYCPFLILNKYLKV